MRTSQIIKAWGKILGGQPPSVSIEITRECPLRCPGCYAYDEGHLGGGVTLRGLRDFKGQELVERVLEIVDRLKPLHLSIVGGDPLVRYRELETMVPQITARGVHVQVVTSAFRVIPESFRGLPNLTVAVSVDGLPAEHDQRRKPATYDRILKNIAGHAVTVHCTITGQMMKRPGYLEEFTRFWSGRAEVHKIWFSLFTPQIGDQRPEMLTRQERARVIEELLVLRRRYPKIDMPERLIRRFARPPQRPAECAFALTTRAISADLKTEIGPCQFGGNPDCTSCGCIASMGLAAVSDHKVAGLIRVETIFRASLKIGSVRSRRKPQAPPQPGLVSIR